jgi:hypothetical protein
MERRELFPILASLPLAAQNLAAQHDHAKPSKLFADDYQLRAFTPEQDQVLNRLAGIIIPDDPTSRGAEAARVSRYFDLLGHYLPEVKKQFLDGLAAVEAAATGRFGRSFAQLSLPQQTEIVGLMAENEGAPQTALERFFAILKFHTVEGYRLTPIGMTEWMKHKPHPGGLYPDNTVDGPEDGN